MTGHPPTAEEPLIGADPGKLGDVKAHEMLLRFAFGAAISLGAGAVSIVVNPVAGGMFLAFPAILPATLTLIEKREGTAEAVTDVEGAAIGAAALVPFAAVGGYLLRTTGAPLSLTLAFLTWLVASIVGYLAVETFLRRTKERRMRGIPPAGGLPFERHPSGTGEVDVPEIARVRPDGRKGWSQPPATPHPPAL